MCRNSAGWFVPNAYSATESTGKCCFSRPMGPKRFKEDFTIRPVGSAVRRDRRTARATGRRRRGRFDLLTGPNHLYISTNEPAAGNAAPCAPMTIVSRARLRDPLKRIESPRSGGSHAARTDPRSRPSRPHGIADAEARREPEILRRCHGHDHQRTEGRVGLSAWLGRLRALFAEADGIEDLRHGAHGAARTQPAGA